MVAPVPASHESVKPVIVIDAAVRTAAVGAIIKVVTGRVFDGVSPPLLWAVMTTLYSVFGRLVKVADVAVVDAGVSDTCASVIAE